MAPAFQWQALGGAAGYELEVSNNRNFSPLLLHTTTGQLSFDAYSSLPPGVHYWRVRSGGGIWSPAWAFTVPAKNPPAEGLPTNGANLVVLDPSLSWSAVHGATSYQVQLAPDDSFLTGVRNLGSPANHLKLLGLARDAHYWWRVRAKFSGGFSAWSDGRSFSTPSLEQVSLVTPADGASVGPLPTFDWTDVTGATGYRFEVSSSPSFNTLTVNVTVANSITKLSQPLSTGTVYWRVRPVARDGTLGPWSAAHKAVVQ